MSHDAPGEPELWALVRERIGEVSEVRRTERGFSSDLTALVECEKGPFFVKAVRDRPGGRRESFLRERAINPFVRPISPSLVWGVEDAGWIVLGFDAVDGRHADFGPGSSDLTRVVALLDRISALPLPGVAREWPETRWDRFAEDEAQAALFSGDTLLHTDINPGNVLLGDAHADHVVDWSWPTHGAAFIDPAWLVVQLVASGHTPAEAESWAARCAGWGDADPAAIDAFAAATVRMHEHYAARRPDETWLGAMTDAARAWAGHRGVAPRSVRREVSR
jgi:hypothetical protein